MIYKLLEYPALYGTLRRFHFIKDAKGLNCTLVRIDCGLWGLWYIAQFTDGFLCTDGSYLPLHTAHLVDVGPVIGRRDPEAAAGKPFYKAWFASLHDAKTAAA